MNKVFFSNAADVLIHECCHKMWAIMLPGRLQCSVPLNILSSVGSKELYRSYAGC